MISIRPPEYFPQLSYVALMQAAEQFVLADTFQYSRQSFQNRAKVRNAEGWQWVSVPLRGGQHGLPQTAVRIRQVEAWKRRHWKAFEYNYRATPFFAFYEEALRALFAYPWMSLADLTCASVRLTHELFGLTSSLARASDLTEKPANLQRILCHMGASELLCPPSSASVDAQSGSTVRTLRFTHPRYRQAFTGFEPGMTAFDLLCNYGPDAGAILRASVAIGD